MTLQHKYELLILLEFTNTIIITRLIFGAQQYFYIQLKEYMFHDENLINIYMANT